MGVNLRRTLKPLLAERGWTQAQLADATGIRRTDINAIATGRLKAGPKRLQLIADALGVTPFDLGAPAPPAQEPEWLPIADRLRAIEDALNRLGPDLAELGRRVTALERQGLPRRRKGNSA